MIKVMAKLPMMVILWNVMVKLMRTMMVVLVRVLCCFSIL